MARSRSRISEVRVTGPLASFVDPYRRELATRGYTPRAVVSQLRQAGRLSRWLEVEAREAPELTPSLVEEFLAWQRGVGRHRSQWSRPGLVCLLEVLEDLGALCTDRPPAVASPREEILEGFRRHLLAERGLAESTTHRHVDEARRFLQGLAPGTELPGIAAADVTRAVLARSSAVSVTATQNFVAGLRSFLRFCFVEGLVSADLVEAALCPTGRRPSSLPRGIAASDAAALLASCDRRSAVGRRDYAVIVILLRLGLRRSEVAGLRLDDIDWRAGELVVRGKGAREDRLPLPADVGAAIASYLRKGRPPGGRREVFLRARAPYGPIAPPTVASTVRRACRRAGIAEVGSHRLRHTTACEMVAAGVSLVDIAQVLRHHRLQTTAVYARVDVEALRGLAAPWPGSGSR